MSGRYTDVTRRSFLRAGMMGGALLYGGPLVAACAGSGGAQPPAQPTHGGTLRVAVSTGRGVETMDPHFTYYNYVDAARVLNVYDGLVRFAPDGKPRLDLAEELGPDAAATTWTLRLRDGVTFHSGRTVTADDVMFSMRRAANVRSVHAPSYEFVDLPAMKKGDARTVIIPMLRPVGILPQLLADASPIVPQDFDPTKPIGSGPFSVQAFQPGRESDFTRNPNYWKGPAYLDQVIISGIADAGARLNALKAGQVDLIDAVPAAYVRTLTGATKPLRSAGAGYLGLAMNTKTGPFQDERVRRAMRLIIDRKGMAQQVFSGYARVANDIYAPADPAGIDQSIAQWTEDIQQAKSLLRSAGQAGLTIELTAAPTHAGAIEMCTVLAEQAKAAGVTINVRQLDVNAFVQGYGTYPFAVTTLEQFGASFVRVSRATTITTARYNDTKLADPAFDTLVSQATSELDSSRRAELIHQAQRILHDRGGYLIWGYPDYIDGASARVGGFTPHHVVPLGGFDFRGLYVTG